MDSIAAFSGAKTLARNCANCGGLFWTVPSKLKLGYGNFCSRACACSVFNSGKKSDEHRAKISRTILALGLCSGENNPNYKHGPSQRNCEYCGVEFSHKAWVNRRFCSKKCSAMSRRLFGEDHPGWKGGIGARKHEHKRMHTKAKQWREAVFAKDGYACAVCGSAKPRIHAHHILEWAKHPDKRYDTSNGVTLCVKHHQELHPGIVLTDTRKYLSKSLIKKEI